MFYKRCSGCCRREVTLIRWGKGEEHGDPLGGSVVFPLEEEYCRGRSGEALPIRINPLSAREQDLGKAVREQHAHIGHVAEAFLHPGGQC